MTDWTAFEITSAIEQLLSSADVFIFLCHGWHALVFTAVSTSTRCAARSSRKTTMWNACSTCDAFHFAYTVHSNVQYLSRRDPAPALNFKHDEPRDPPLVEFLVGNLAEIPAIESGGVKDRRLMTDWRTITINNRFSVLSSLAFLIASLN